MQSNAAAELTHKLLRSLDSNYNVIDMHAVVEIISLLEKVAITKELLETTRLGKHVNELRRNTTNESLAKRAKELVKKWRSMVLPDTNGQAAVPRPASDAEDSSSQHSHPPQQLKKNKRPIGGKEGGATTASGTTAKRSRFNGQTVNNELDLSDNSNSSFKDALTVVAASAVNTEQQQRRDVILINSDSNSSMPEVKQEPQLEQQQPKKRGRKKGSKNHRNLLDEAETSFTNKMAVSRGNAKVKTTQELVASLQNKNSSSNSTTGSGTTGTVVGKQPIDDLSERAAKLTERVSIIDQKLNTNSNRYKNSQRKSGSAVSLSASRNNIAAELSGLVGSNAMRSGVSAMTVNDDDDIIVVDDVDGDLGDVVKQQQEIEAKPNMTVLTTVTSLSVEEALAQLPPVDRSCLEDDDDPEVCCSCRLLERKNDVIVTIDKGEDREETGGREEDRFEFLVDGDCQARAHLAEKYRLGDVNEAAAYKLHADCISNVNGNYSLGSSKRPPVMDEYGLYVNVVPDMSKELVPKDLKMGTSDFHRENYKKYNVSDELATSDFCGTDKNSNLTSDVGNVGSDKSCISGTSDVGNVGSDKSCVSGSEDSGQQQTFCEWHEVVEAPSYGGEILRILPYVVID